MIIPIQGGLHLFDPTTAPDGMVVRAKNVVFDRDGIIEIRGGAVRGLHSTGGTAVLKLFEHNEDIYSWSNTDLYKNGVITDTAAELTVARPEAVRYAAYNSSTDSMFFLNGTDRKRVEGAVTYEWGVAAPTAKPVLTDGSGSGLTGDYNVKYTFLRKEDSVIVYESNFSPTATSAIPLNDEALTVSGIESPSDSQITHVRVYRTTNGGSTYYKDTDITAGTTTVALDDSDYTISLNTAAHDNDHDRPPLGNHCAGPFFGGYVFILKDNKIYWCKAKQPEYWPSWYWDEISEPQDPGMALIDFGGTVFALTKERIVQIQGTGSSTFFPVVMESFCGTFASDAVCVVPNQGIYHLGKDGIYLFRAVDSKVFPELDPIFSGRSVDGMPDLDLSKIANCWMASFSENLLLGYPSTSATTDYPDTVVRIDTDNGKISRFDYPCSIVSVVVDKSSRRLYAGDTDGYAWRLDYEAADTGTDIAFELETKQLNTPTREFSPKWARYDTYCNGADTLSAEVIVDGVSVQTHDLSGVDRSTKPRLINDVVGNRISIRFSGTGGDVKIYGQQEIE